MPIKFSCSKCDKRLTAPDDAEGKLAPCPKCGHQQKIPPAGIELASAATIEIEEVRVVDSKSPRSAATSATARRVSCPHCGEQIVATAVLCRFCGENVDDTSPILGKKERKRVRRELHAAMDKIGSAWRWISGFLAFIGFILLLIGLRSSDGAALGGRDPQIVVVMSICTLAIAAIGGVCSWGCYQHKTWALYVGLIISYLAFLDALLGLTNSGGGQLVGMLMRATVFASLIYQNHKAIALSWKG